ncbi:MAG: hypothetical protein FJ138_03155 [Deltaproteobacteria bacterium]|nr:hypothetical protein [Deltaproteobacteria bacterium]
MHTPRAPALALSLALSLTLSLALSLALSGCADGRRPAVLDDAEARAAGLSARAWMERRVALMVEHKASCEQMAHALLSHDREAAPARAAWRAAGAQEWLVARAQVDKDFERALGDLITKGDLVYSYCAFFESFRQTLARGESPAP